MRLDGKRWRIRREREKSVCEEGEKRREIEGEGGTEKKSREEKKRREMGEGKKRKIKEKRNKIRKIVLFALTIQAEPHRKERSSSGCTASGRPGPMNGHTMETSCSSHWCDPLCFTPNTRVL